MGQVLHGGATTTAAVRRAIQHSQESLRGLAKRYGINPKTVAKLRLGLTRFRGHAEAFTRGIPDAQDASAVFA